MISVISYLVPGLGLIVCLLVVFTRRINTKCPIRVSKMCMWLIVWMLVMHHDYPYDAVNELFDMAFRMSLLIINCLYIAESMLERHKRIKQKTTAP